MLLSLDGIISAEWRNHPPRASAKGRSLPFPTVRADRVVNIVLGDAFGPNASQSDYLVVAAMSDRLP